MKLSPSKLYKPLFQNDNIRYVICMGGRASGRSYSASQFALINLISSTYFRCAIMRFVLGDIRNSIFQEIRDRIEENELENIVEIKENNLEFNYGTNKINGIGFRKSSLDQTSKLKSLASYNCVIIEEADEVDKDDFQQLDDSLRTMKSDITIILLLNPPPKNHWIIKRWFNLEKSEVEGFYKPTLKSTETDAVYIHGTYLDNIKNINQKTIDNYERYKITNPDHYYNMIRGLVSEGARGRIFKDWKIISDEEFDNLPYDSYYGLDFGFSCLSGSTMVKTINGDKRIDKIKKGELVLTRNGFKKVIWSGSKGIKKVYSVDFGYKKRIIMTGDHNVYTKTGWKEVINLSKEETICELRKSLMEEFIVDILTGNILFTFILKVAEKIEFYIGIFMKNILVKYLKTFVFIILIKIPLIIIQKILLLFLNLNIKKYIIMISSVLFQKKKCKKYVQDLDIQKIIGKKEEKKVYLQRLKKLKNVLNVVRILHRQTFIKNFVGLFAGKKQIQEKVKNNILVKIVEKFLLHLHIMKETHALKNVPINLRLLKEKEEVFDLTIEGEHEFFANGILVHNCDPAALIEIKSHNDNIWFKERLYEVGLTNVGNKGNSLSERFESLGLDRKTAIIYADSAEPKSIQELCDDDWDVRPAPKGKDSVRAGIDLLLSKNVHYTESSVNLGMESQEYLWKLDKNKEPTNEPIDDKNHGIDAGRYGYTGNAKEVFIGFV